MPVEGPLREFGIHDVFQLLDLSRKTGLLRVTSPVRTDEAHVFFDAGKVVQASMGREPETVGDLLVSTGKITPDELEHAQKLVTEHNDGAPLSAIFVQAGVVSERELERLLRTRLETVVFDLMGWRDGFFSFEERPIADVPVATRVSVATESLLMESARRIDEWSRIADKVPNLTVIPALAPVPDDHESQLDLLPPEWEVLTMIDGARDLRSIASDLGRDEFDVAKVVYGLATTGVVEITQRRLSMSMPAAPIPAENPSIALARSMIAAGRFADAVAELRKAAARDGGDALVSMELGFACVRVGDLRGARTSLERFLQLAPGHRDGARARAAIDAVTKLMGAMEAGLD
ncbi:MAG TPA: DUF4388 domain-containing protein [Gemmatimonadaceae bacterium]